MIKIVTCDMDETLLGTGGKISDEDKKSILSALTRRSKN